MRATSRQHLHGHLATRCVAAVLTYSMLVFPAAGQASGDQQPATKQSTSSADKTSSGKTGAPGSAKAKSGTSQASTSKTHSAKTSASSSKSKKRKPASRGRRASKAERMARTAHMRKTFVASTELRPMAQQLAMMRTPEAYAGVTAYARKHTGEAAAAAYLALGHAYLLDKRYTDAQTALRQAKQAGVDLADFADFLGAQACHAAGDDAAAETLLHGFMERYPDSIFDDQVPELEADVLLAQNNPTGALKVLQQAAGLAAEDRPGYQLAMGQAQFALGQKDAAQGVFKRLLLDHPLSPEGQQARARLTQMGAESTLTEQELSSLADAYYKGSRYVDAAEQYRALMRIPGLSEKDRNAFAVSAAACDWKLKRLTPAMVQELADTDDDSGARRLYLLMELARDRDDTADQQRIVDQMETRFQRSQCLAEALFSSGNMYLLKRDYPHAVQYYKYLADHFPEGKNAAAAHWRAGWLSYRQRLYSDAASLFEDQIRLYPSATETAAALYWQARLYELVDHKPAMAAANYRAIVRTYQHFFYAQMARARLAQLGDTKPVPAPQLDHIQPLPQPKLVDTFPADSPQLAKARLLANAGLNEYIAEQIAADPNSESWSALAEAQIYASFGETFRAMRSLKRAMPYAASASIESIPLAYWRILFPEPYWETIKAESAKNNLDPYLVASLIRQESEFNPSVISYANAWGLMQLLPSVGKQMAREEGMTHFQTFQLLDPETNIRLGTRYLRQMLDQLGGVPEYALAAYNAGANRVTDWQSAGPYQGMDEFVESIPFTQTREYVQAILRNIETYKAIDEFAKAHSEESAAKGQ
jgi:soluble lytic murein transglycosylase